MNGAVNMVFIPVVIFTNIDNNRLCALTCIVAASLGEMIQFRSHRLAKELADQ